MKVRVFATQPALREAIASVLSAHAIELSIVELARLQSATEADDSVDVSFVEWTPQVARVLASAGGVPTHFGICAALLQSGDAQQAKVLPGLEIDHAIYTSAPTPIIQSQTTVVLAAAKRAADTSKLLPSLSNLPHELVSAAIHQVSEGISISDVRQPEEPLIYVNPGFTRMTGYQPDEVIGLNCRFLQGDESNRDTVAKIRSAINERRAVVVELLNYRKDGRPFWNRLRLSPLKDSSGEVTHYVGIQMDISDEVREREAALDAAASEAQQLQYVEAIASSGASNDQMLQILDMLHVRFNQDMNYSFLNDVASKPRWSSKSTAKVSKDAMELVQEGVHSVARFGEGIQIAQKIVHGFPSFTSLPVKEFSVWLKELATEAKGLARHRNQDLAVWIDLAVEEAERGHIHLDEALLKSSLLELLTNACKYSDEGDAIRMSVSLDAKRLEFVVANPARTVGEHNGKPVVGLPQEVAEFACQYFVRFSKSHFNDFDEQWPIGLGLPLTREVIRRHGGRFSIKNEEWHFNIFGGENRDPVTAVTCRFELPVLKRPRTGISDSGSAADDASDDFELF